MSHEHSSLTDRSEISRLIAAVARRHDGFLARGIAIRALGIAAGVLIAAALFWVLRGRSVPWLAPAVVLGFTAPAAFAVWWVRRMDNAAAARETDRFFDLKDAIASARHLSSSRPDDSVTDLQWHWLAPRLAACDAGKITAPFPRRAAVVSSVLAAIAAVLCLLPPSAKVRAAERAARETREAVADAKEELAKTIDELEKETTAEEKDAAKMDEFRKMVEAIKETGDRSEAARQFARIEQKIRDASKSLEQRRDEETLHLAAKELAKAEETEARQLAKKIDAKELKEAAEMMKNLELKKTDPKEFKNAKTAEAKKQAMDEAKKELARMRSVSKRLAAAGKQRQGARSAQGSKANDAQGQDAAGESSPMENLMAEIDQAAEQAEKELEEMEIDPNASESQSQCQGACDANSKLAKLGQRMKGMQGKRIAKSKLDQLRDALARAAGQCQNPNAAALAMMNGGKQPGTGSDESRRTERDDSQKNGQLASLKGQHGQGPSLSSVEQADQGSGTSNRGAAAKQHEFARQTESFVQRDDIPETLKTGVRDYFKNLQPGEGEK